MSDSDDTNDERKMVRKKWSSLSSSSSSSSSSLLWDNPHSSDRVDMKSWLKKQEEEEEKEEKSKRPGLRLLSCVSKVVALVDVQLKTGTVLNEDIKLLFEEALKYYQNCYVVIRYCLDMKQTTEKEEELRKKLNNTARDDVECVINIIEALYSITDDDIIEAKRGLTGRIKEIFEKSRQYSTELLSKVLSHRGEAASSASHQNIKEIDTEVESKLEKMHFVEKSQRLETQCSSSVPDDDNALSEEDESATDATDDEDENKSTSLIDEYKSVIFLIEKLENFLQKAQVGNAPHSQFRQFQILYQCVESARQNINKFVERIAEKSASSTWWKENEQNVKDRYDALLQATKQHILDKPELPTGEDIWIELDDDQKTEEFSHTSQDKSSLKAYATKQSVKTFSTAIRLKLAKEGVLVLCGSTIRLINFIVGNMPCKTEGTEENCNISSLRTAMFKMAEVIDDGEFSIDDARQSVDIMVHHLGHVPSKKFREYIIKGLGPQKSGNFFLNVKTQVKICSVQCEIDTVVV